MFNKTYIWYEIDMILKKNNNRVKTWVEFVSISKIIRQLFCALVKTKLDII